MKKKWKKAIGFICVGGMAALYLTGCSGDRADNPKIPTAKTHQSANVEDEQPENKETAETHQNANAEDEPLTNKENDGTGLFFDGANLQGSVVEFSDEGFILSPATVEKEEGGGEVMAETVPGSESDENNIRITYTDNTVFRIVNLSLSSQSEVSREDTDKESVKKQSGVCVFGSCQDSHHWTADKIMILRWQ